MRKLYFILYVYLSVCVCFVKSERNSEREENEPASQPATRPNTTKTKLHRATHSNSKLIYFCTRSGRPIEQMKWKRGRRCWKTFKGLSELFKILFGCCRSSFKAKQWKSHAFRGKIFKICSSQFCLGV